MFGQLKKRTSIPSADESLAGRDVPMSVPERHFVLGTPISPPFPAGMATAMVGMGCFWGAEKRFWETPGVFTTAVGYAGGHTPNPTYDEVCSGMTGHNEVVFLAFDPKKLDYSSLLRLFWEGHDPTQGMRQGNDVGTQYRSGVYCYDADQLQAARDSAKVFQAALRTAGKADDITTEIIAAPGFYYAEGYHQQYLAKNPGGYCGLGGTGVCYPATA